MPSRALLVGIGGGSGSGKTRFARALVRQLGAERASLIEMDWYYRDLSALSARERAAANVDRPEALEVELLELQLDRLRSGSAVEAPVYAFGERRRLERTRTVRPAPFVIVEGLFALATPSLQSRFDASVFIDVPADLRLIRRIRRDLRERGYSLEAILQTWERQVRPAEQALALPGAAIAERVWNASEADASEEAAFVAELAADLEERLASHAKEDNPIG